MSKQKFDSAHRNKPSLLLALRLRCPYCGVTPLQKRKSWILFRPGCEPCDYVFEREDGYYGGATHIGITLICLASFAATGILMWRFPTLNTEVISATIGISILILGTWSFPYNRALWIYFDHRIHPLGDDDSLSCSRRNHP